MNNLKRRAWKAGRLFVCSALFGVFLGCHKPAPPDLVEIAWRVDATGYESRGQPIPRELAEAWLPYLARPGMSHWITNTP